MPSSEELEVLRQRHKEYYEDRQAILEMSDSDIEESMCRIIAAHDRKAEEYERANCQRDFQGVESIPHERVTKTTIRKGSRINGPPSAKAIHESAPEFGENCVPSSLHSPPEGVFLGDAHDERVSEENANIRAPPGVHPEQSIPTHVGSGEAAEALSTSKHQCATARDKVLKKTAARKEEAGSVSFSSITTPTATPNLSIFAPKVQKKQVKNGNLCAREQKRLEAVRKQSEMLARKKEKDAEKRMTPAQYAAIVQNKFRTFLEAASVEKQFLKGMVIFYVGGDHHLSSRTTRDKMDFITKKGGLVAETFDPGRVTHIVTETSAKKTLAALGLDALKDIPQHIPTVLWSWIVSGNRGQLAYTFLHAAFASRVEAGSNQLTVRVKDKGKQKAQLQTTTADADMSRISEFTPEKSRSAGPSKAGASDFGNRSPTSKKRAADIDTPISSATGNNTAGDPLAEFYARALRNREAKWSRYTDDSSDSEVDEPAQDAVNSTKKSVFTCDQIQTGAGTCINQDIIDKLQELMELHQAKLSKDDYWKSVSYTKSIRAIRACDKRIQSYEQARTIPGVGDKTALKIKEIIETGRLERIKYERTNEVVSINIFRGIYGVGPKIAHMWYAAGCSTLDDVKARKGGISLSAAQEIGVQFYDDINSRIPRNEVAEIFDMIKSIALSIDPSLFVEVMGSYRRGKVDCGDIDVLVTRPHDDGRTHRGIMRELLKQLHQRGILTEDLVLPDNMDCLEATYRGLCRRDSSSPRRRIDILTVPYESRGAALLYYTGDDIFNRAMRYKAAKMGYSLNHLALSANVIRSTDGKRRKLTAGTVVASETEEEIFRILDVPWQEPHERVRNFT